MPAPVIAAGVTGAFGLLSNKLSGGRSSDERRYSAAQAGSAQAQTRLANLMSDFAKRQFTLAQPAYTRALGYYNTLLGGNRAAMGQAVAPEAASISDRYAGAQRGLERSFVRGGERDLAMAELGRSKAADLSSLIRDVRPRAAGAIAELGQSGMRDALGFGGAAGQGFYGAGSIYGNLVGNERARAYDDWQRSFELGKAISSILGPWLGEKYGTKPKN